MKAVRYMWESGLDAVVCVYKGSFRVYIMDDGSCVGKRDFTTLDEATAYASVNGTALREGYAMATESAPAERDGAAEMDRMDAVRNHAYGLPHPSDKF